MRRMLAETQCTLREADSTLCERKAAHHAASVEVLAGEASEDRARCWSRQDCTVFRKELEWELQAFSRANAELELLVLPTDKRHAAHLRTEKVDAAVHYARQVVERVLLDHDHGWEEPQRFGLDHHRPIRPEESCEQGGRRGVQAGSVADEEGGPQRVVQMEDEIWGLQEWAWHPPREAEVDSGGRPGESRLGTQRPGQASQLTWRGIGSERPRMPPRSCRAPSRGRGRRPVDLDYGESPARLRGSWCSSTVNTRAHQNSEAVTSAGRDTARICTGARTATRRRWRLSGLDHMGRPARLRGSRRSREASAKAGQVAARERSARQTCRGERAQRCPRRGGCPQAANDRARQNGGQPSV
jgi:hypothetical protein